MIIKQLYHQYLAHVNVILVLLHWCLMWIYAIKNIFCHQEFAHVSCIFEHDLDTILFAYTQYQY